MNRVSVPVAYIPLAGTGSGVVAGRRNDLYLQ
jgi:hypothetical protein